MNNMKIFYIKYIYSKEIKKFIFKGIIIIFAGKVV